MGMVLGFQLGFALKECYLGFTPLLRLKPSHVCDPTGYLSGDDLLISTIINHGATLKAKGERRMQSC
jgi:hypothetical protein